MFRTSVVMMVKKAEGRVLRNCKVLPAGRSMDEEIQETLKRKKLARLQKVRKTLVEILFPSKAVNDGLFSSAEGSVASAGVLTGDQVLWEADNKGGVLASDDYVPPSSSVPVVAWDSGTAPPTADANLNRNSSGEAVQNTEMGSRTGAILWQTPSIALLRSTCTMNFPLLLALHVLPLTLILTGLRLWISMPYCTNSPS